jgi:hypothetical protein
MKHNIINHLITMVLVSNAVASVLVASAVFFSPQVSRRHRLMGSIGGMNHDDVCVEILMPPASFFFTSH